MSWVFRSCGHGSVSTCRMSLRSAAWRNNLGILLDLVDWASCSFGDPGWNCRIYRISDIHVGCVHYITPNLLFLKRPMSCCRFPFNLQKTFPHSNFRMKSLKSKSWPLCIFWVFLILPNLHIPSYPSISQRLAGQIFLQHAQKFLRQNRSDCLFYFLSLSPIWGIKKGHPQLARRHDPPKKELKWV